MSDFAAIDQHWQFVDPDLHEAGNCVFHVEEINAEHMIRRDYRVLGDPAPHRRREEEVASGGYPCFLPRKMFKMRG